MPSTPPHPLEFRREQDPAVILVHRAKNAEHSIKTMCRVLGVSRSGFQRGTAGRRRRGRSTMSG